MIVLKSRSRKTPLYAESTVASSIASTPDSVFVGTFRPAAGAAGCCFVVMTTRPTVRPRSASHCAPLRRRPSITTLAIAVVITLTCEVTAAVTGSRFDSA